MTESQAIGKWSIAEAENAVKALFFRRGLGDEELPLLRWIDFEMLRKGDKPISPRTLGRALNSLKAKGELVPHREGKAVRYSLNLKRPRGELIEIAASADTRAVQAAAKIGGIYAMDEGWAFYGVSPLVSRSARSRIREEVRSAGGRLDKLLDQETERFIRELLRKPRRLGRRDRDAAECALRFVFKSVREFGASSGFSAWVLAYLERVAPGATVGIIQEIEARAGPPPSDMPGQLRWLARAFNEEGTALKQALRRSDKTRKALETFMTALPPRVRDWTAREVGAWIQLLSSWCAVLRVA